MIVKRSRRARDPREKGRRHWRLHIFRWHWFLATAGSQALRLWPRRPGESSRGQVTSRLCHRGRISCVWHRSPSGRHREGTCWRSHASEGTRPAWWVTSMVTHRVGVPAQCQGCLCDMASSPEGGGDTESFYGPSFGVGVVERRANVTKRDGRMCLVCAACGQDCAAKAEVSGVGREHQPSQNGCP